MQKIYNKVVVNIGRILAIDFHIAFSLLYRIWAIFAGGVTIILIPVFMTSTQQGFFYTFMSVIGLQIFFELGLNHVLIQMSSQAGANLRADDLNSREEPEYWKCRVASLIFIAKSWYSVMAVLFFFALAVGGYRFFNGSWSISESDWLIVWPLLVFLVSVNLALSPQLAICEGLGEVGQVAKLRLSQSILGNALLWTFLVSGAGLWAILSIPIINLLGTSLWLNKRELIRSLNITKKDELYAKKNRLKAYLSLIYPLQWRVAISWASAYFIYNFITPVVFAKQGPIEAGKIGLALSVFNSLSTLGVSWVSAKVPEFGAYIARRQRTELNNLFAKVVPRALGSTAFLSGLFIVAVSVCEILNIKITDRLPPIVVLVILSLAAIVNLSVFSMSAYMRAHREEPMLLNFLVSAVFMGCGIYYSASRGIIEVAATYTLVIFLVTLPWCLALFRRYWSRSI